MRLRRRLRRRLRLTVCSAIACLALLSACSSIPGSFESDQRFIDAQLAAARDAEANDDLASALNFLKTVEVLRPGVASTGAQIERLQAEIARRSDAAVQKGTAAYQRGDRRGGDRWMLEAMALRPGDPKALQGLRMSAAQAADRRQAEKLASEFSDRAKVEVRQLSSKAKALFDQGDYSGVVAESLTRTPAERAAMMDLLVKSHIGLADRAKAQALEDLELEHVIEALALSPSYAQRAALEAREVALRESLSKAAYLEGLALMQDDLPLAIGHFERAITYAPDNLLAKDKLMQAQKLQRNLEKIRSR